MMKKMNLNSLGRMTDIIFANFAGNVIYQQNYIIVKTPSNPGYHWGNYIIFDTPPQKGDYDKWIKLFDQEFTYYQKPHHYVFAWDVGNLREFEVHEFLENGFELEKSVVLTGQSLKPPKHPNQSIVIKKIETQKEWDQVIELQVLCADPKYLNNYFIEFKKAQILNYQKMSQSNLGHWFGAFLDDQLVGDLGIFHNQKLARYQSVGTHPDHRRRGICASLVYEAGNIALKEYGIQTLVMEADPAYHAARIYESVGFSPIEENYSLSWWKK